MDATGDPAEVLNLPHKLYLTEIAKFRENPIVVNFFEIFPILKNNYYLINPLLLHFNV